MTIFIIKKIFHGLLILLGVLTIVFFLFNILPADPARMMLDKREDAQQLKVIQQKYAFDRPLIHQYLLYINDISPFSIHYKNKDSFTSLEKKQYNYTKLFELTDIVFVIKVPFLRESFLRKDQLVTTIIYNTFKNTFVLALSSILIALIIGVFLGIISAIYKDTVLDKLILFVSVIGMSLPSFFASIIIAWLFGFVLHQYTGLSMTGSLYEVDDYGRGSFLQIQNLILPAITLGIRPLAVIVQLCRNSLIDILSMDYIRTASAKGLSQFSVIFKHALSNALNPVVTAVSGWFA